MGVLGINRKIINNSDNLMNFVQPPRFRPSVSLRNPLPTNTQIQLPNYLELKLYYEYKIQKAKIFQKYRKFILVSVILWCCDITRPTPILGVQKLGANTQPGSSKPPHQILSTKYSSKDLHGKERKKKKMKEKKKNQQL